MSRWRASGVSCDQFARKHRLSSSTLYRWAQQQHGGGTAEGAAGFAELRVVGAVSVAALEVAHPSGCVVRVSGTVDQAQLSAVLRALGAC